VKTLMIAATLLALASPTFAAPRSENPQDLSDCRWTDDETACFKEGAQAYREGQCFRARPSFDDPQKETLWIRGYQAHQTKKQGRRNDEHCFPGRGRWDEIKEKH
jgi:hypothetical protein